MVDRCKLLLISGWAVSLVVTRFMLSDVSPDPQKLPWALTANARLGVPSHLVLAIGITGLVYTFIYLVPRHSVLGAILPTGFFGGAAFTRVWINGNAFVIGENILIAVLAWVRPRLRDARIRALLPIMRDRAHPRMPGSRSPAVPRACRFW